MLRNHDACTRGRVENKPRARQAQSGRAALRHRLEQLGFTLSREELQQTYYRFVALADRKKNIYDQDLIGILPDPIRDRKHEPVAELD